MTINPSPSDKKAIQAQATHWVQRIEQGLSSDEKYRLTSWLNQNEFHYQILLTLLPDKQSQHTLNQLSGVFPIEHSNNKPKKTYASVTLVASIAVFSIFTAYVALHIPSAFFHNEALVHRQTFNTQIGEQNTYVLPDGTSVKLNTNSTLNIDYSDEQRKVILSKGEAQFNVAKDKNRPFTVTSGEQSFTALGTIFNVQKENDYAMELVVTEGTVLITKANENLANLTKAFKHPEATNNLGSIVTSGEKAIINEDKIKPIEKISLAKVQQDLSWQQGMLIFNGESLSEALNEVSRYTHVDFQMIDPTIANIKISGYFKIGDTQGLLASLKHNFNISHTQKTNSVIYLTPSTASLTVQ